MPTTSEQDRDDRQSPRPPRLEQLLAEQGHREAVMPPASPSPADEPQEHVLEGRPRALERRRASTPAATTAGRSSRRGRGRIGDGHRQEAVLDGDARHPLGAARRRRGQAPRPPPPARARAPAGRPAARTGPAARRAAPRPRAARGRGCRPGRRSARRRRGRGSRRATVASPRSAAISARRSRRPSGSSELTGSSRMRTGGRWTSAWAIPSRWRMPPE